MMVIDNKYEREQMVYLKTDTDQLPRIVTSITIHVGGLLEYELACGDSVSSHYECEIAAEENILVKRGGDS
jgi:hypothetical protein